ncbi:uncharacterized protein [Apostichopus japonicus]|uniref:uncharacterized protein n=1 Tax=Stichopus japonicus TaxID=307972 RepID=UPI003AB1FC88
MARLTYTRDVLLNLRNSSANPIDRRPFTPTDWDRLKELNIARKTKRGCRGGLQGRKSPIHTVLSQRDPTRRHSFRGVSFYNLTSVRILLSPTLRDVNKTGPKASLATWNAGSMKSKISSITDLIIEEKFDILTITESWLNGDQRDDRTIADLQNALPHFNIQHRPRQHRKGGGVCLLSHKGFKVNANTIDNYCSFEYMDSNFTSRTSAVRILTIYRPPPSRKNKLTCKLFFEEFSSLLETLATHPGYIVITGDFNFHVDDPLNQDAAFFLELLDSAGFQQHVDEPNGTHRHGHTLDLIISRKTTPLVSQVSVLTGMPSDHSPVKCVLNITRPSAVEVETDSRNLKAIDISEFKRDIADLPLSSGPISDLAERYDTVLRHLLDEHAPLKHRTITLRPHAPWYSDELQQAKQQRRRLERRMMKSGSMIDRQLYFEKCELYRNLLDVAKQNYHRDQIENCSDRQLFQLIDRMCKPSSSHTLPDHVSDASLAEEFAAFFNDKVRNLRDKLYNLTPPDISVNVSAHCESTFTSFDHVDDERVRKLIMKSPSSSCSLDPIPMDVLKSCLDLLLPHITSIVNYSLSTGVIPESLKSAQVVPILKK